MTFENKIVVGLDDIKAVTLQCAKCGSRISVLPDRVRVPNRCPHCDQQWLPDADLVQEIKAPASPYILLCNAIRQIRELKNDIPFTILLEFEGQS